MISNPKSSVAISGATSFTGLWIAREFANQGWQVHAQCSQLLENYTGLRRLRAELLRDIASVQWNRKVEDFPTWIREVKPKIWVHHHHFMKDFRSQKYDSAQAIEVGLKPLPAIVDALAESGCQGIIYSGSFFEPGEGGVSRTSVPTPYAESKKAVWEELQKLAGEKRIPVSKMVIPNPIGPFENEDRLIPQMIEKSKQGQPFRLGAPASVSDQLPITYLAQDYVRLAEGLIQGKSQMARPSGWVCSVEELVHTVNQELIVKRLGLPPCSIETAEKPGIPTSFINSQNEREGIQWSEVWDHYAEWVQRYPISRF
jgi:nucleoside-diphosphate-sugar epimerase